MEDVRGCNPVSVIIQMALSPLVGNGSGDAVTAFLSRALSSAITDPRYKCICFIDWSHKIGISFPLTLWHLSISRAISPHRRSFCCYRSNLGLCHGSNMHLPSAISRGWRTGNLFCILARAATESWYQERFVVSVSVLMSLSMSPLLNHHAFNTLGPAIGHLQHKSLLLGVRFIASCYRHSKAYLDALLPGKNLRILELKKIGKFVWRIKLLALMEMRCTHWSYI